MKILLVISLCCILTTILIFLSGPLLDIINIRIIERNWRSGQEDSTIGELEKTVKTIYAIREMCGDLCNTTKQIKPGHFIGTVTAKVDCATLFKSPVFHTSALLPPQSLQQLPPDIQDMYSYQGRVETHDWYWDAATDGGGWSAEPKVFTKDEVQKFMNSFLNGTPIDTYQNGSNMVSAAADFMNLTDKTVLVIGTQQPWLEAVLLTKSPRKIVTLEYGHYLSEYPGHSFIRPDDFRKKYLNGTLDKFDAVFSFSSIEHSGLGRYGDALNPWGDILAIAESWCVTSPEAFLALSVPTRVIFSTGPGSDILEYNAHRIYGPVMYPFLTTNWHFVFPSKDSDRVNPASSAAGQNGELWSWSPVFVFKKYQQQR